MAAETNTDVGGEMDFDKAMMHDLVVHLHNGWPVAPHLWDQAVEAANRFAAKHRLKLLDATKRPSWVREGEIREGEGGEPVMLVWRPPTPKD